MITVNTKPLLTALNLAVVNSNVSKYYKRSCLAQITISPKLLKINLEAANVVSEITIAGATDAPDTQTIFVDNMLFKQLISTLTTSTVSLDIRPDSLVIVSGKSKFTLAKMVDGDDLALAVPSQSGVGSQIALNKAGWKFVKDNQMYAIAMSFMHPAYARVWVGQSGDVLVGDFDKSLFTHSRNSDLGKTCLLSDTIINLLNSLPEGASITASDTGYVVSVATDGFTYVSEFTPESEDVIGSYNSEIILGVLNHPDKHFAVAAAQINQILSQALLLSTDTADTIKFHVDGNVLRLMDNNVNCQVDIDYSGSIDLEFITDTLKSVISSYGDVDIRIGPSIMDDEVVGIVIWNDEFTTTLAGV